VAALTALAGTITVNRPSAEASVPPVASIDLVTAGPIVVPGAVTIGLGAASVQLLLAALVTPILIPLLLLVWSYMGLMTVEFFAHAWLSARLSIYMLTHMLVMPLIDLYITAFDWLPQMEHPPGRLWIFLFVSFCNGIVIEIGRKTWALEMEREGVESYSSAWGIRRACAAWSASVLLSGAGIVYLSATQGVLFGFLAIGILAASLFAFARQFSKHSSLKNAKRFASASGLWVFLSYFWLGPMIFWLAR